MTTPSNADISTMSTKQLREFALEMQKQNSALTKASERPLGIKISDKGCVSVYGLGRWPVSLYKDQWRRLIPYIPHVERFLNENDAKLPSKADNLLKHAG